MKVFAWIIAAVNVYFGALCFLNVIHVLHDSKYSQGMTAVFAVLFLGMGGGAVYWLLAGSSRKQALLIGVGPWALALLILLVSLMTSNYQ